MKSLKSICVALCAAVVLVGCNVSNTANHYRPQDG